MPQDQIEVSIGIVDPDPSSRTAVARLLLANGYRPPSFASCEEYADHVASAPAPALLLVDVRSYLALGAAQRKSLFAGSTVIALGDECRIEDIGRALGAGCVDYLVKPVPPALLLHVVADAVDAARHGEGG